MEVVVYTFNPATELLEPVATDFLPDYETGYAYDEGNNFLYMESAVIT